MNRNILITCGLILLFGIYTCYTQTTDNFGVILGGGYNHYSVDLRQSGLYSPDVPRFADGSGSVIFGGVFYEHFLSSKLSVGGKLYYSAATVNYSKDFGSVELLENGSTEAILRNDIKFDISTISFEPILRFYALRDLSLFGGFCISYSLADTKNFVNQTIVSPSGGRFANGSNTRSISTAVDPSRISASFVLGAEYLLPFGIYRGMRMGVEATGCFGYFKPENNSTMDVNTIRFSIALHIPTKLSSEPTPPVQPIPAPAPAPVIASAPLVQPVPAKPENVVLTGIKNGTANGINELVIENYRHKRVTPLLGYIFFDANSSRIPDRYTKSTSNRTDGLDDYHNILNIIADRMIADSSAELFITGCNSDEGDELGNIALSRARASAVANYIASRGVTTERFHKSARNLPEVTSNTFSDEGKSENRRVEISSNRPDLLSPIVTKDTAIFPDFDTIIVRTSDGKSASSIRMVQSGRVLFTSDSIHPDGFVWDFRKFVGSNPNNHDPIEIFILDGSDTIAHGSYPMREITLENKTKSAEANRRFEEISLILFDFDKSEPSRANRDMIRELAKTIDKDANVTAEGFTDDAGNEEYNKELSRARAEKVAGMIHAKSVKAIGYGESRPLYRNDTPEGRFYNRTVRLMIEVPDK